MIPSKTFKSRLKLCDQLYGLKRGGGPSRLEDRKINGTCFPSKTVKVLSRDPPWMSLLVKAILEKKAKLNRLSWDTISTRPLHACRGMMSNQGKNECAK